MFSSIQARLWLTYALVVGVALCVVAVGLLAYLLRNPLADRQAYTTLENAADTLFSRPQALAVLQQQPEQNVNRIAEAAGLRLVVLSASGEVLADSKTTAENEFGRLALRVLTTPRPGA